MSSPWPSNNNSTTAHNNNPDKVKSVQRQADAVADIARENIKLSLNQLERLEDMEERASELESQGREFHRGAVKVRRKFCYAAYRNVFLIIVVLAIIAVVLYFIIHSGAHVGIK